MKAADCEICGSRYTAQKSSDAASQLHTEECPLGRLPSKCLKSTAASLLRSAPIDIDLRATSRHRIHMTHETDDYLQNDRVHYANVEDFDLAPWDAFRHDSDEQDRMAAIDMYVDNTRGVRLTQTGMLNNARRRKRRLSDPIDPEFGGMRERSSSFDTGRDFDSMDYQEAAMAIEKYARNGFYINDEGVVKCFHCGITFCRDMLNDASWIIEREHARWSPFCTHLLLRKGKIFVQSVLEDTRRLYMERNGYLDTLEPDTIQTLVEEGYDEDKIRMFVDLVHENTGWYPDRNAILHGIQ